MAVSGQEGSEESLMAFEYRLLQNCVWLCLAKMLSDFRHSFNIALKF